MDGLDGMKNAFGSSESPFINYVRILEIEFRRVDSEVSEVHLISSAIHKLFTEHNFLSLGHGQFMADKCVFDH
jgi:hypothetical protein